MTPLQPSDDRAADRDNGGTRQTQDEPHIRVRRAPGSHLTILTHVADCDPCRRTMFTMVLDALAQGYIDFGDGHMHKPLRRDIPSS
jgi:hypothetical protein